MSFGSWPYEKPVFVLSNTLTHVAPELEDKIEIMSGEAASIVERLNARGMQNLYVDGGATIQRFLQQDLIDELIVTWVSILLGSGVPLFGPLNASMEFSLAKTEKINDALVKCHYLRQRLS